MRTISAAMEKILSGQYATHLRASILDSGATWRDLTALDGRNWLLGADWGGSVDAQVADANVTLVRDVQKLSLSPLMSASKLNLLTGSYAALVDIGREIKIEAALTPSGVAPATGDWLLMFHGVIDELDFESEEIRLRCSDLGRKLDRAQIKSELVYPCCPNYHRAPVWRANTAAETLWTTGNAGTIRPTVANGYAYCWTGETPGTTGATEPTWPTTTGASVADGTMSWTCVGALPTRYGAAMWEPSKAVSVGDVVAIETGSGYLGAFRCKTAGTTSPDAPSLYGWDTGSPAGWTISILSVANSTLYRVAIGGTNCDYTSDSSATDIEIQNGLISAINAKTGTHGLTAAASGGNVYLTGAWKLVRVSANLTVPIAPDGTAVWDALVRSPTYNAFGGKVMLEDLIDMLLRDWGSVTTLSAPVSTAWVVGQYAQQEGSLLAALDTLAGMIGWTFRYRYDASSASFLPTLYCVDRAKSTVDRTLGTSNYDSIDSIGRSMESLRNSVDVVYSDASASPINGIDYPRKTVSVTDATSIAAYGEQWCRIAEASSSLIDTSTEATALANAVLSDLKDPLADQSASMRLFPFVELDDRYTFSANGVHYDTNQTFAVTGYRHSMGEGAGKTTIQCRQRPSGGFNRWHKRLVRPGAGSASGLTPTPPPSVTVENKNGACVVTVQSWWRTTESAELYVSATAGLTPSASNFNMRSRSSKLYVPLAAGTYYGRAIVRDSRGNASASSAEFVLKPT